MTSSVITSTINRGFQRTVIAELLGDAGDRFTRSFLMAMVNAASTVPAFETESAGQSSGLKYPISYVRFPDPLVPFL